MEVNFYLSEDERVVVSVDHSSDWSDDDYDGISLKELAEALKPFLDSLDKEVK